MSESWLGVKYMLYGLARKSTAKPTTGRKWVWGNDVRYEETVNLLEGPKDKRFTALCIRQGPS